MILIIIGVSALELKLKLRLKEDRKYRLFKVGDRSREESYIRILSIFKIKLLLKRPGLYCPILKGLEKVFLRGSLYIIFANNYILTFLKIMFIFSSSV
jgi:hypothetical protein